MIRFRLLYIHQIYQNKLDFAIIQRCYSNLIWFRSFVQITKSVTKKNAQWSENPFEFTQYSASQYHHSLTKAAHIVKRVPPCNRLCDKDEKLLIRTVQGPKVFERKVKTVETYDVVTNRLLCLRSFWMTFCRRHQQCFAFALKSCATVYYWRRCGDFLNGCFYTPSLSSVMIRRIISECYTHFTV